MSRKNIHQYSSRKKHPEFYFIKKNEKRGSKRPALPTF